MSCWRAGKLEMSRLGTQLVLAIAQLEIGPDWEENLQACTDAIDEAWAQGAELVVLPEASLITRQPGAIRGGQPLDGPFVTGIQEHSARMSIAVVVGTLEAPGDQVGEEDLPFNTVVAIDSGRLVASYRKLHLYDAFGASESSRTKPGDGGLGLFSLGGFRVGILTCYDLRFPEQARLLALAGADVLVVPSAWVDGERKSEQLAVLGAARAIENTCFSAIADKCGGSGRFVGGSRVWDPLGASLAELHEKSGVAVARLSRARLDEVRASLPVLTQRRFRIQDEDELTRL